MEVVAEAIISVSLEALFKKLASSDLHKFARQEHVQAQLQKWEKKLLEIREVLDDAEEKQITKQSVRAWLADLRDLAFDMEDVLDEFSYEALRRKLIAEAGGGEGSTSKVRRFIPNCCTSTFSTPFGCMRNVKMGSKIKGISARLQLIYAQKAELGLDKVAAIYQSTWVRPLTTSLAYEPWVYGRDADKQAIINMLLRDEPSEINVSVVSIVAMGGMGKTTLARLVYDDVETSKHFNLKAWVCVSDQFDAMRVTKTILNSVTSKSNDSLDFNQSQDKLRQELNGKRFLLVLDDMWNENYDDWCCLQSPFLSGSPGSKIIVTTRSRKVAIMMEGDKNILELKSLSDDECWSVFRKHAFGSTYIDENSNLAFIGKEIVKKCGGLPLAAKALGGLLRHEHGEDKWNIILNSKIWELSGDKCGILPALRLSYNHLSSPLKGCFSYCAIIPQDFEFDKDELIRLWMAESLIPQSAERCGQQMEDIGDDYFEELLSRSFFQPSNSNESKFVMHDLVNDLAKFVSRGVCFSLEVHWKSNEQLQKNISRRTRYASFVRGQYDVFKKFEAFHMMESLRTFIGIPIGASGYYWLSSKVVEELVPKLRRLRVLSLIGYSIKVVPDSFGDLKHLRYLNLSKTATEWLPESICNLYNLETLILSNCQRLIRLPHSIGNLSNLRHLDITHTYLQEMPSQMSKLTRLRVLSDFIVGKKKGSLNVKELKSMSHLGRGLRISKLENVANVQDARDANLNKKHKLEELRLEWSHGLLDESQISERNQMNIVLESLQPHSKNLKTLGILCYGGSEFPCWVRDVVSFSKMVAIDLVNCRNCTSLPALGRLPLLQRLNISGLDEIKTIGSEFYGEICLPNRPFPSLESLTFQEMSKWETWEHPASSSSSSSEPYPRLLHLEISYCLELIKTLPTHLPSLVDLSIWQCPQLVLSAGTRLPSLSQLRVEGCNEAVLRSEISAPSLTDLFIENFLELTRLDEGFMRSLSGLRYLVIFECHKLRCLWENGFGCGDHLDGIRHLQQTGLGKRKQELPTITKLESLQILRCKNLEKLPSGMHMLTSLKNLSINFCPKLVSLSDDNYGFPPMLRHLDIGCCKGLRCLPDAMMMMKNDGSNDVCLLESLEIERCSSLVCFPKGQLPTTLKRLILSHCYNLSSFPQGIMHQHQDSMTTNQLEYLSILSCPSLTGFPEGELPATLKHLYIGTCHNLKSLPGKFPFPPHLKLLKISYCGQLESISEEMFHSRNNSLECLVLQHYPYLKILPDCLYNLRVLRVENCENVELKPHQLQNLTALTSLTIYSCQNIKMPLSRWGLPTLTSLKKLAIGDIFPEVASFSDDQNHLPLLLLPTSLASLSIEDFPNLESLSSLALQSLTSLEMLSIKRCPKLRSFCPREGLPDTLSQLCIGECPLLEQRCSNETGQDWPNIAHIPYVQITSESIFGP